MKEILITGGNGFLAKEIKSNLENIYKIYAPARNELNLLDKKSIKIFFDKKYFDVVIHTAVVGGSKDKPDTSTVFYDNLKMFFNLLEYKSKFDKLLNLASGASYDRSNNINGDRDIQDSNPDDYYGFSKNIIERTICTLSGMYNLRIFNIFSDNEKETRFIKTCKNNIKLNNSIIIDNDRYFDFFHVNDFVKVIKFYIDNEVGLEKDVDICYKNKYKLSDIANIMIKNSGSMVKVVINGESNCNYIGDYKKLYNYGLKFDFDILVI